MHGAREVDFKTVRIFRVVSRANARSLKGKSEASKEMKRTRENTRFLFASREFAFSARRFSHREIQEREKRLLCSPREEGR